MTTQETMQAKLSTLGIPAKDIHCYGSQIVITAWGQDAAHKWASVLAKFSKVKAMRECFDYNQENKNTCLLPSSHKVWRVWATI